METITKKNTIKDKLLSEFELSKNSLFGNIELREHAAKSFSEQGIPNRKHEEYKYVNIDLLLKGDFSLTANKTLTSAQTAPAYFLEDAYNAVIVNGIFDTALSKLNDVPKDLHICSLADAVKNYPAVFENYYSKTLDVTADPFTALNTAMAKNGLFIHAAKNSIIEKPIHIIHISSSEENTIIHPRNLIVIEENAQIKIVESYQTIDASAKTFNNALTEMIIDENASLDHYKIQDENDWGFLVNTTHAVQKKQSRFSTHTFILSGSFVRNNLNIALDGEYTESHLNGLYLTNGNQVVDNHTLVDHRKPNCNSNELYKGIIDGKSTAIFNGKIYVRKDAQKTNAFQSNKNILLSDDGTINTKPQLEIYADDVKCSHGTSTGKLDEDKIFYLRARGLSETSAKKLLMHAFASQVVDTIKIDTLREYVEDKISKRFE